VIEINQQLHLIEIKSGETIASDWFAGLKYWQAALGDTHHSNIQSWVICDWLDAHPLAQPMCWVGRI
jgi:hypothetical protein